MIQYGAAILKSEKERKGVKKSKQVTEVSQRDRATPHNLRTCARQPGAKSSGNERKGVKRGENKSVRVRVSWVNPTHFAFFRFFQLIFAPIRFLIWPVWSSRPMISE